MGKHPERKGLVQQLRTLAKRADVERCSDTAGRSKVQEMMQGTRDNIANGPQRVEAESVFARYDASKRAPERVP